MHVAFRSAAQTLSRRNPGIVRQTVGFFFVDSTGKPCCRAEDPPSKVVIALTVQRPQVFPTVVLVRNGQAFTRSAAAIEIAARLELPWNLLTVFQAVPEPLRDMIYDLIAQNRYQLFGKKEACMLPSEALRKRFLEEIPV